MALTKYQVVGIMLTVFALAEHIQADVCPNLPMCNCWHNNTRVICKWKGLNTIPGEIPSNVEHLDLRHNTITRIGSHTFSLMTNLEIVLLDFNLISAIEPLAFSNLTRLRWLSLPHNKLTSITKQTFLGLAESDSFTSLIDLLLNDNLLSDIEVYAFSSMPKLHNLNLAKNRITEIQHHTFSGMANLKSLWLKGNFIRMIDSGSFRNLTYLEDISLDDNRITTVYGHTFSGLSRLKLIFLSKNVISSISQDAFTGLDSLITLSLTGNALVAIPDIGRLPNHATLILRRNKIHNATFPASFQYSRNLQISLDDNNISYIDTMMFQALGNESSWSVTVLRNPICDCVSVCKFSRYGGKLFYKIRGTSKQVSCFKQIVDRMADSGVEAIGISGMNVLLEENAFKSMHNRSIDTIEMSRCHIPDLTNNGFVGLNELKTLSLTHSSIGAIYKGAFNGLNKLRVLNLDRNELKSVSLNLPTSLKTLSMKHNEISDIGGQMFMNSSHMTVLDLSENNIESASLVAFMGLHQLSELRLDNNKLGLIPQGLLRELFRPLVNLTKLIVSRNQFENSTNIGDFITAAIRYLDLSDNMLTDLTITWNVGQKTLEVLHLARNNLGNALTQGGDRVLFGLNNLTELDLSSNNIKYIDISSFQHLHSLTTLTLCNNDITVLKGDLFMPTQALVGLDISNNSIYKIEAPEKLSSSLKWVNLSRNQFVCDCDLLSFRDWMELSKHFILTDYESYKCYAPEDWKDRPVHSFHKTKIECMFIKSWPILLGVQVVTLLVLMFSILSYKLRWRIKLYVYQMFRKRKHNRHVPRRRRGHLIDGANGRCEDEAEVMFDAYISCAEQDYVWVEEHLLPGIDKDVEGGGNFRLYYEHRDGKVGHTHLANIQENMAISRKVIVVLSEHYLNPMNRFESDIATELMYEREMEEIIVIHIQQGLPLEKIPRNIVNKMKRNRVLEWHNQPNVRELLKATLIDTLADNSLAADREIN